jgi:hypothetical protein
MIQRVTLTEIRQSLKDRWESVPFWSDEEARVAINEALAWWNLFTGTWKRRVVIGLDRHQWWIALPAPITYGVRIQVDEYPLSLSSIWDLDHGRPNWENEHTQTGGDVPTRPMDWAPAGLQLFAIWPAEAIGTHTLVVDGVQDTPTLVEATDYVDLPEVDHGAIIGEALHVAAFKEGGNRWKATENFHKEFLTAAGDQNQLLKRQSFFRKYLGLDKDRFLDPMRVGVRAGG